MKGLICICIFFHLFQHFRPLLFLCRLNATDVKVLATAFMLLPLDVPVKDWRNDHILPQAFLQYFGMTHWIETEL